MPLTEWPSDAEYAALVKARDELNQEGPGGYWNWREKPIPRSLVRTYRAYPVSGELHVGGPITAAVRRYGRSYRSGMFCGWCHDQGYCGFYKFWEGVPTKEIITYVQRIIAPGARITVRRG